MNSQFLSVFQNNAAYVEEVYEQYLKDPFSVGLEWRGYFQGFADGFKEAYGRGSSQETTEARGEINQESLNEKLTIENKLTQYVTAWKQFGHLHAKLNPLFEENRKNLAPLELSQFGLQSIDPNFVSAAGLLIGFSTPVSFQMIQQKLKEIFTGHIAAEFEHIYSEDEKKWLWAKLLEKQNQSVDKNTQKALYTELAKADALEKTIATKYIGKKRFSIEGADSQIPALETLIDVSAQLGTKEFTVGSAHRGRLNILVNTIHKPLEKLLAEWEGYPHDGILGDSDVKYHAGYECERESRSGKSIRISMYFNPSHLEYVNAVSVGDTRARQDYYYNSDRSQVLPILLHGEAAFAGQGIVFETIQMMSLTGYNVGGTIHIVVNNQVGFTTDPVDARSSHYASDIAKVTHSPVLHVNTNDIEAVHKVMEIAAEYRAKFKKDITIELVCFRRFGHNEADEPNFTQPVLYKYIKDKPNPFELYQHSLVERKVFAEEELKNVYQSLREQMNASYDTVKKENRKIEQFKPVRDFAELKIGVTESEMLKPCKTQFDTQKLKDIAEKITQLPSEFHPNTKLAKIIIQERKDMSAGQKPVDWGMGEILAYATLMNEGFSIRLAGEDAQRGTFSHRHLTLIDAENGARHNLLSSLQNETVKIENINTLLSEEGAMGVEYGYAIRHPKALVLWEAQFGDFANGAQVIIDQFIAAGESKWCQTQGLVLLLPHGYEGQGPEHSSARLERFLQLCAEGNMQVCYFTNVKQLFHALRRQVLRPFRKPMVVMTPKSFLRSPRATCSLEDLASGSFEEILNDSAHTKKEEKVERVVFCSGKIALDLLDRDEKEEFKASREKIAIVRVEQLYPLHHEKIKSILSTYKNAKSFVWTQEEPANMGAWNFISRPLEKLVRSVSKNASLVYMGRSHRASPAVGLEKKHIAEQDAILTAVYTLGKNEDVLV